MTAKNKAKGKGVIPVMSRYRSVPTLPAAQSIDHDSKLQKEGIQRMIDVVKIVQYNTNDASAASLDTPPRNETADII